MSKRGTVRLQGKEYKTVALRMSEFRERFSISDGWAVVSIIHAITDSSVLFRAEIRDPDGRTVGTGHASGPLRGSKALEKCETTAIGRALAAIGLTGEEYASADEIKAWIEDRGNDAPPPRVDAPPPRVDPPPVTNGPKFGGLSNQRRFMAELAGIGVSYPAVKAFCNAEGWGSPSGWEWSKAQRFLASMKTPGSDVRARFDSFNNSGA